jgi:alpha-ketoglutarate-dependent taurine dioxygenase
MSANKQAIEVRRVAGHLGAEITGVLATADAVPEVVAAVRAALLEHRVVFLRGQHHLTDADQAGFAGLFGELTGAHPTLAGTKDEPRVFKLDAQRGGKAPAWHTDATYVERPPALSFLSAVTLPPYGGDTSWANTVTAYAGLAPELRGLADSLRALHSNVHDYSEKRGGGVAATPRNDRLYRRLFTSTVYETEHPVVRVHPETGDRALMLGQFVKRIIGVSSADSRYLFELFQNHVTRLENTLRWRWTPGDLAIWDNRATQHYAIDDYGDLPRQMRRVTVVGDVPVGVSGQYSTAVTGNADEYSRTVPV